MSIIFKRNEVRAVIGHYELPLRLHWQIPGLLDWMTPEMNGLEILSEHKHNERAEYIPVFMLTDRRLIGDLDQAFLIGVVMTYVLRSLLASSKNTRSGIMPQQYRVNANVYKKNN